MKIQYSDSEIELVKKMLLAIGKPTDLVDQDASRKGLPLKDEAILLAELKSAIDIRNPGPGGPRGKTE